MILTNNIYICTLTGIQSKNYEVGKVARLNLTPIGTKETSTYSAQQYLLNFGIKISNNL